MIHIWCLLKIRNPKDRCFITIYEWSTVDISGVPHVEKRPIPNKEWSVDKWMSWAQNRHPCTSMQLNVTFGVALPEWVVGSTIEITHWSRVFNTCSWYSSVDERFVHPQISLASCLVVWHFLRWMTLGQLINEHKFGAQPTSCGLLILFAMTDS